MGDAKTDLSLDIGTVGPPGVDSSLRMRMPLPEIGTARANSGVHT